MEKLPHFESENEIEVQREEIENGVWRPSIFKEFDNSLGVGASTKELKRIIKRSDAKIRITGKKERFDEQFSKQDEETRKTKIGAGRILINFLKRIAPEVDPHNIEKTAIEHGDKVIVIDEEHLKKDKKERAKTMADGMITNLRGIPLMVAAADCAPIGIYDPENQAIGVFHSGWRGTLRQIASKGIEKMAKSYGSRPEQLLVAVGPYAGGNEFEVDEKVYNEFHNALNEDKSPVYTEDEIQSFFKKKEGHYFLDIGQAIKSSLIKAGIPRQNIQVSRYSTMSEEGNQFFSSERIEGKEERDSFALMMVLR